MNEEKTSGTKITELDIPHQLEIRTFHSLCGYKPHLISRFYKIYFSIWDQSHLNSILTRVCWTYQVTRYINI